MVPTMNARRFQTTHALSGTGSLLNASKDIGMGNTGLVPISEPLIDARKTPVVAYLKQALSARTDLRWRHMTVIL